MKIGSRLLALLGGGMALVGLLGWYYDPTTFYLCKVSISSKNALFQMLPKFFSSNECLVGGIGQTKMFLLGGSLAEETSSFLEILAEGSLSDSYTKVIQVLFYSFYAMTAGATLMLFASLVGLRPFAMLGLVLMVGACFATPITVFFTDLEMHQGIQDFFKQYSELQAGVGGYLVGGGLLCSVVSSLAD